MLKTDIRNCYKFGCPMLDSCDLEHFGDLLVHPENVKCFGRHLVTEDPDLECPYYLEHKLIQ